MIILNLSVKLKSEELYLFDGFFDPIKPLIDGERMRTAHKSFCDDQKDRFFSLGKLLTSSTPLIRLQVTMNANDEMFEASHQIGRLVSIKLEPKTFQI